MGEDRVPLFVRLPRAQSSALDELVHATGQRKQQLVSEMLADQLEVGRIDIREGAEADEILTLEEAAALLRVPLEALRARALAGELPGRAFEGEWRFSRLALLGWLAECEAARPGGEPGAKGDER